MEKHTPGPWKPECTSNGATCRHPAIIDDNGQVGNASWRGSEKQTDANARLLASAPDLLAALDQCRFALEPYDDIKPRDWKTDREKLAFAHQVASAAIAKATGG